MHMNIFGKGGLAQMICTASAFAHALSCKFKILITYLDFRVNQDKTKTASVSKLIGFYGNCFL